METVKEVEVAWTDMMAKEVVTETAYIYLEDKKKCGYF